MRKFWLFSEHPLLSIINYQLSINSPSIPRFLRQIYGGKKHPLYNNNQPLEAPKTATLRHVKPL